MLTPVNSQELMSVPTGNGFDFMLKTHDNTKELKKIHTLTGKYLASVVSKIPIALLERGQADDVVLPRQLYVFLDER